MKQKETKILMILIAIILIVGTIIICTKGLAYELKYQNSKKIEINLGKSFEEKDIRDITNQVFEKEQVRIQGIEVYKDAISITSTEMTEEQKNDLINKINERYETELDTDDIVIEEFAHIRGRDIVKPYIVPFVISTLIIIVYLAIRYNKLNGIKVLLQSIGIIVLAQVVLLNIIAITRMPIGRFTIPVVLMVYMLSTYICTTKFDKELEKKMAQENKK